MLDCFVMEQHIPERTVLTATCESGFSGVLSVGLGRSDDTASLSVPCAFGRSGVSGDKREGDMASPLGVFRLRTVHWRPDRGPRPVTGLPTVPIRRDDGWCDDPAHPLYNCPVRLPFAARHETMRREDAAYDIVVTLDQNTGPVRPGAGSAVFVHLTKTLDGEMTPTEGCVALREPGLRAVLTLCAPGARLKVEAAPD